MMIDTNPQADNRPQPALNETYDVIIVGGGPAGSTAGALLAESGQRVLILERSPFPRFHIGESLIPECYWTLSRLGLIEQLRNQAFSKKFSVQFVTDTGKESAPFYFDEYRQHESSQTWQVVRSDFDLMLLNNATEKGATAHTDAQVLDVLFEGAQAVGVRVKLTDGAKQESREIRSKVVIDATGQSAFLANRLGLKKPDERLKKGSVWTYFQGAHRDPGKAEGATIILQTEGKKSWFWYIPLPNDIVSVGCTGSMQYMFGGEKLSPEQLFNRERLRCVGMQRRLQQATRYTEFFTTKDFSYRASRAAGPGWVLIGDAFGFIDPVYSTGVFLALKSGEFAADAISEAFKKNDFSAEQLGCWQKQYVDALELFRKLVYAFYTPGFSFGEFLREHPGYRNHLVDMLIGDVFKPGMNEMFEQMGEVLPPSDLDTETVAS